MRQTLDEQDRSEFDALIVEGNAEPPSDADRLDRSQTIHEIVIAPTSQDHHGLRAAFMRARRPNTTEESAPRLEHWSNRDLLDYCRQQGIEPVFRQPASGAGQGGAPSPNGQGQPQPGDGAQGDGQQDADGESDDQDDLSDAEQPDDDRIRRIATEVFHDELAKEPVEERIVEVLGEYLPAVLPDVVRMAAEEVVKHLPAGGVGGRVEVQIADAPPVRLAEGETMHRLLPEVLMYAALRQPVLLVGPAGSGKSYLARQVATILKAQRFAKTACSVGMSEGVLLGRLLPTGEAGRFEYQASEWLRCYEEGGVFLLDEVDAADANTLLVLNDALANGTMSVPPRLANPHAQQHSDFVLIAAANTYGTGADRLYVGRNQLDEAFLDRFRMAQIEVDYDRELETRLCPDAELRAVFWRIRDVVLRNRMHRVVSTRALIHAYQLRARGLQTVDYCVEQLVKGWTKDERVKVGLPGEPRTGLYRRIASRSSAA